MSTMITAPSGLVPLSAPLPQPRQFTLLDAAQLVDPENDRWLAGAWIEGYAPGPAHTHDPCSTGTDRMKADAGIIARPMAGAFTAYLAGECTGAGIGPRADRFVDRLTRVFTAVEAAAVERVFATGDGHSTLGAYLTDGNLDQLASGAAQPPVEGLALLEQAIADTGGGGLIHVGPALATHWAAEGGIQEVRGQMQTKLGTRVAVGAGYIGAFPDGGSTPAAGTEWAFATGPVAITRSEVFSNPADYAQALDRTSNLVVFIAERHYLLTWIGRQDSSDPDHIQAGVLVDRTP